MPSQEFASRPINKLLLFDVDGTLTPARQVRILFLSLSTNAEMSLQSASAEILDLLKELKKKVVIGFVGGSDLVKITEQLNVRGNNSEYELPGPDSTQANDHNCPTRIPVVDDFDFVFAENGLTAYRLGKQLQSQSFIKYVGEERYKKLVNFILHYVADLDIPIKRSVPTHFID
jgi:phosphomannomutase